MSSLFIDRVAADEVQKKPLTVLLYALGGLLASFPGFRHGADQSEIAVRSSVARRSFALPVVRKAGPDGC